MSNIYISYDNEINLILINDQVINTINKLDELKLNEKVDNIITINIQNIDNLLKPSFNKYNNELINKCFILLTEIIKQCKEDIKDKNSFKIMFETNQYIKENDKYIKNPNYEYIWITFNKLVEHKDNVSYNIFTSYNLILEDYNRTFISKSSNPQTTKYSREKYIIPIQKIMLTNSFNKFITIDKDDYDIINHNLIKDICKNSITIA